MIRRLFDRLTGAHYCDICRARLPRRLTQDAHSAWDHAGDPLPDRGPFGWWLDLSGSRPSQTRSGGQTIRALPADPDDGTGWSA